MKFSKAALECIVENYTRESGVRELEKKINKVMRKIALEFARDGYEVMHEINLPMYANTWARQNIAATNTKEMNTPVLSQGWRGQLSEVKFCL